MDLKTAPGSRDVSTIKSLEGSSPHHQTVIQSFLDLPGRLEFSQTYRYLTNLPAQAAPGYGSADARLSWRPAPHYEFSIAGQNLLQPHHFEWSGQDPGTQVGIRRNFFAAMTWR